MSDFILTLSETSLQMLWFATQIILGLLLADFVTGFFHWLEDRYGGPSWPVIGPIIRSTIRHHKKPRRMVTRPFFQRNGLTYFLAACFAVSFLIVGWVNPLTITAVLFGAMANEFHNWSHKKPSENGPLITWLQKTPFVISPFEHAKHHRGKKNTHYCAVTGWMNEPLERVRFWRKMEAIIRAFARLRPRRDPTVRRRPITA